MRTLRKPALLILVGLAVLGLTAQSGTASLSSRSAVIGENPYIDVEKYVSVNGSAWEDADVAPGPDVLDGCYTEFKIVVTNLSYEYLLLNLVLTDDALDLSGCTVPSMLFPRQTFECVVGPFECTEGQHTSTVTATGLVVWVPYGDTDDVNCYGYCNEGNAQPGTGGAGYWKNHPEAWPVTEITVGGALYTREQAIELMGTPGKGDRTYSMFRQLVAGMLNVMIGNESSCIADVIFAADDWMAQYPPGSGVSGKSAAWQDNAWLHDTLVEYNQGLLCAPPREP